MFARRLLGPVAGLLAFGLFAAPAAAAFGKTLLRYGTPDHADVTTLQEDLQTLGYGITVDGYFGAATRSAVISFQRKEDLSADAIVGPQTYGALAKALAVRTEAAPSTLVAYTVQSGDTLASVASAFHTSTSALAVANRLPTGDPLKPGETLLVPASAAFQEGVALVQEALKFIGVPYRWGGASPAGFDCSGLVEYVAGQVGIRLPRTSRQQFEAGTPVARADLSPGDLVFFDTYGWATHVGIYIGDGLFVESPATGGHVNIQSLSDPYWSHRYIGARRVTAPSLSASAVTRKGS